MRKDGISKGILSPDAEGRIVKKLCEVIRMGNFSSEELICCILALGWICDQRENKSELSEKVIQEVCDTISNADDYYSVLTMQKQEKACRIAIKMVNGDLLNVDEEQFLLTKLEQ